MFRVSGLVVSVPSFLPHPSQSGPVSHSVNGVPQRWQYSVCIISTRPPA